MECRLRANVSAAPALTIPGAFAQRSRQERAHPVREKRAIRVNSDHEVGSAAKGLPARNLIQWREVS